MSETCATCKKGLKVGVLCCRCSMWKHKKCEKLGSDEPNLEDRDKYVCKSCRRIEGECQNNNSQQNEIDTTNSLPATSNSPNQSTPNHKLSEHHQDQADNTTILSQENKSLYSIISQQKDEIASLNEIVRVLTSEKNELLLKIALNEEESPVKKNADENQPSDLLQDWKLCKNKRKDKKSRTSKKQMDDTSIPNKDQPSPSQNPEDPTGTIQQHLSQTSTKRKVIILADSHGRKLSAKLKSELSENFEITGIVKPNARLHNIVQDIDKLSAGFTHKDCIIIIGGANDVASHDPTDCIVLTESTDKIASTTKITNVIMCAVPARFDNYQLDQSNYDLNMYLNHLSKKNVENSGNANNFLFSSAALNLNRFVYTKQGLHLNDIGKNIVCKNLASQIEFISSSKDF